MSIFSASVVLVVPRFAPFPDLWVAKNRLNGCVLFSPHEQDLKEEIDIRLSKVQDIKYEPQLLADDDARLLQLETQGNQSM